MQKSYDPAPKKEVVSSITNISLIAYYTPVYATVTTNVPFSIKARIQEFNAVLQHSE